MNIDVARLAQFAAQSLTQPKKTAQALIAARFNRGILWSLLLLVVVLSTLAISLTMILFPPSQENAVLLLPPFGLSIVLGSILSVLVFAIYYAGQMLGGQGRFPGALLIVTWWQGMSMVVQILQIIAVLISPLVGGLVTIAGFGWMIAALIISVDALHGFNNLFKSLGVVIIAFLGPIIGLSFILTLIGVTVQGAAL